MGRKGAAAWNRSTPESFWARVDRSGECWLWQGSKNSDGYGSLKYQGRMLSPHRLAYELSVGPIPEGSDLDHLCRNRACANPDHLEVVTRKENVMRGEGVAAHHARQTHCKYGHEFSTENTLLLHRKRGTERICRECHRRNNRANKARRKEKRREQPTT